MNSSKNQRKTGPSHLGSRIFLGFLLCWCYVQADAQCSENGSKLEYFYYHPALKVDQKLALLNEVISCCEADLLNQKPPKQADQCAYAFYQRGNLLLAIGEFERGKSDLEKAVDYYTSLSDKNDARTDLGNYYSNQGLHEEAVAHYVGIIQRWGLLDNYEAGLNLVRDLLTLGRLSDAETWWNELAKIEENLGRFQYYFYELKGQIEQAKGKLEEAHRYYRRSIQIATERHGESSRQVAQCHLNLADNFFLPRNAYTEALRAYQATLQAYIPSFKPKNIYDLPNDKDLGMIDDDIMMALEGRAKALLAQYKNKQSTSGRLEQALDGLNRFVDTETSLRKFFASETSSLFTIARRHEVMELAIEISYELYEATGQDRYIDLALQYSDLAKDIVLKENNNAKEANGNGFLRRRELASESEELAKEYLLLKAEREHLILDGKTPPIKDMLEWEEKNAEHLEKVQSTAPGFRSQKYRYARTDISRIRRRLLLKDQALIEYFIGLEHSYAIVITDRRAKIVEIPFLVSDSLDIQACITYLAGKGSGGRQRDFYERKASQLYQSLIQPIKDKLPLPERLMIIPDGILSSLPFDALIQQTDETDGIRYLIEDHIISLAYSTSLMLNQPETTSTKNKEYLGFAPVEFPDTNMNMPFSRQEVEQIKKILDGDLLLLDKATFENLQARSSRYRIVHMATHGTYDTESQIPFLKLYNGQKLTLSEIYLLNLDGVELVILSACESNLGRAVSGEGIMGLSRGFTYAGCYSMMSTLWDVRQEVGSPLVINYTNNLKKGMEKDRALAAAKRDFLEKAEELYRDPYFWASLVQIGNNDRLYPPNLWYRFFSIDRLIYFFVALIMVLWFRRSARTSRIDQE